MTPTRDTALNLFASLLIAAAASSCGGTGREGGLGEEYDVPHHSLTVTGRIGIELGDTNYVFGVIRSAVPTEDGRVVVFDQQTSRLSMFSSDGGFIHSGGARGEGPGEFTMPSCVVPGPGGGVAVSDQGTGKIVFFDSTLAMEHELTGITPRAPGEMCVLPDLSIIGTRREFDREAGTIGSAICGWEPGDPQEGIVFFSNSAPFDPEDPSSTFRATQLSFAAAGDGRVYVSTPSSEEYSIRCYDPSGELIRTLDRPFSRMRRTEEDMQMERDAMEVLRQNRRGGPMPEWEPDPYCAAITSLSVVGDELWARRGTETVPFYDVYDLDGNPLYTCSADELPYSSDVVLVPGTDFCLAFRVNPDDYPVVYVLESD